LSLWQGWEGEGRVKGSGIRILDSKSFPQSRLAAVAALCTSSQACSLYQNPPTPPQPKRHPNPNPQPHIAQGSWMIRSAVGTTPVIVGRKLATKFYVTGGGGGGAGFG